MGFWNKAWNVAKNIGTAFANEVESSANEIREIHKKYESLSDDELLRIVNDEGVFGANRKEKGVASKVLRSRGHSLNQSSSS